MHPSLLSIYKGMSLNNIFILKNQGVYLHHMENSLVFLQFSSNPAKSDWKQVPSMITKVTDCNGSVLLLFHLFVHPGDVNRLIKITCMKTLTEKHYVAWSETNPSCHLHMKTCRWEFGLFCPETKPGKGLNLVYIPT